MTTVLLAHTPCLFGSASSRHRDVRALAKGSRDKDDGFDSIQGQGSNDLHSHQQPAGSGAHVQRGSFSPGSPHGPLFKLPPLHFIDTKHISDSRVQVRGLCGMHSALLALLTARVRAGTRACCRTLPAQSVPCMHGMPRSPMAVPSMHTHPLPMPALHAPLALAEPMLHPPQCSRVLLLASHAPAHPLSAPPVRVSRANH